MDYKNFIINSLLDKYEERKEGSNRRVFYQCKMNNEIPNIESDEYRTFLEQMNSLKELDLIDCDWIRKNCIIDRIWLVISNVDDAYSCVSRTPRSKQIEDIVKQIDTCIDAVHTDWILNGLKSDREALLEKQKTFDVWKNESYYLEKWLKALRYVDEHSDGVLAMRAFSIKLYSDSKYFEKNIKKSFSSWIRKHEPLLCDIDDLEEREILAYVGIMMMPEIFEFCGNIQIEMQDGVTDYTPMKSGGCFLASCVSKIKNINLNNINKIIFVENRTNYEEYCINEKNEKELVIFHGGFFSPKRGEFFKKIYQASENIPIYFWADIDYGGFKMFCRLKNSIFSNLQPYRMDVSSFEKYKERGLEHSESYFKKLSLLLDDDDYIIFKEVILRILEEKVTIEQESFLL